MTQGAREKRQLPGPALRDSAPTGLGWGQESLASTCPPGILRDTGVRGKAAA